MASGTKRLRGDGGGGEHGTPERRRRDGRRTSEKAEEPAKAVVGEEAEKEAPPKSETGSTPISIYTERVHFATSPAAQQQQKFSNKHRGTVGMSTSPSPSSSLSPASLVCRHMRYILPTLLLLAAVVSAAAEERVVLREPRPEQQPTERPVQSRHLPRRQQQEQREPSLFGSGARTRSFDEDARNHHHGFGNGTALQHAQWRRGANFTKGMKSK